MVRKGMFRNVDQKKYTKLQGLQEPYQIHGDNLNNVRREARKHFRNRKREYLKNRTNETATRSKNKNIRDLHGGVNEFEKGY
jgi:hypothetical protein